MVARGDLCVEVGFSRLSEVQEELLWLGEAARVPVIWATQVLESMRQNGIPTRGDVTDAALSSRAGAVGAPGRGAAQAVCLSVRPAVRTPPTWPIPPPQSARC